MKRFSLAVLLLSLPVAAHAATWYGYDRLDCGAQGTGLSRSIEGFPVYVSAPARPYLILGVIAPVCYDGIKSVVKEAKRHHADAIIERWAVVNGSPWVTWGVGATSILGPYYSQIQPNPTLDYIAIRWAR